MSLLTPQETSNGLLRHVLLDYQTVYGNHYNPETITVRSGTHTRHPLYMLCAINTSLEAFIQENNLVNGGRIGEKMIDWLVSRAIRNNTLSPEDRLMANCIDGEAYSNNDWQEHITTKLRTINPHENYDHSVIYELSKCSALFHADYTTDSPYYFAIAPRQYVDLVGRTDMNSYYIVILRGDVFMTNCTNDSIDNLYYAAQTFSTIADRFEDDNKHRDVYVTACDARDRFQSEAEDYHRHSMQAKEWVVSFQKMGEMNVSEQGAWGACHVSEDYNHSLWPNSMGYY